jgi:hypothetical protein
MYPTMVLILLKIIVIITVLQGIEIGESFCTDATLYDQVSRQKNMKEGINR